MKCIQEKCCIGNANSSKTANASVILHWYSHKFTLMMMIALRNILLSAIQINLYTFQHLVLLGNEKSDGACIDKYLIYSIICIYHIVLLIIIKAST